eukprot:775257-Rhodomonas_salina.1
MERMCPRLPMRWGSGSPFKSFFEKDGGSMARSAIKSSSERMAEHASSLSHVCARCFTAPDQRSAKQ